MSLKSVIGHWLAVRTAKREARKAAAGPMRINSAFLSNWWRAVLRRNLAGTTALRSGHDPCGILCGGPGAGLRKLKPWVDRAVAGESDILWPGVFPFISARRAEPPVARSTSPLRGRACRTTSIPPETHCLHFIANSGRAQFLDGKMIFLQGSPELQKTRAARPWAGSVASSPTMCPAICKPTGFLPMKPTASSRGRPKSTPLLRRQRARTCG